MTKTPQKGTHERMEHELCDKWHALIAEQVLHALGEPRDLLRVQVRLLWADHFRANVLVGPDAASARVAHSYFLTADADGHISASVPQITKQYRPAVPEVKRAADGNEV